MTCNWYEECLVDTRSENADRIIFGFIIIGKAKFLQWECNYFQCGIRFLGLKDGKQPSNPVNMG